MTEAIDDFIEQTKALFLPSVGAILLLFLTGKWVGLPNSVTWSLFQFFAYFFILRFAMEKLGLSH